MANDDAEVEELRAVALKNAESILNARRRAERELLAANEALERKTEELLEQREWFQISLSSIGDALITTDVDGKVALLNPVAERMTAWTSAQAERQPLEHCVPAAGHAKQDGHTSGGAVIIRRILLADDNQDFADSLAMLLRRRVTKLS